MKKSTKAIGIGAGAVVVIVIILGAAVVLMFRAEVGKMVPLATGQVRDGIYAVKDQFVNIFLVKGTDGYVAFDAGDNKENVEKEFRKLKIDPGQVTAVFLSHSDDDHTGAVRLFRNARVFISEAEEQMVNGQTPRFFFLIQNALGVKYEGLKDNQAIEISGITVKGIMTPGHTPGSMCYLVNGRDLFTGDLLSLQGARAGLFNEAFNMDSKTQKRSIRKLKNTPGVQFIYTAHYGMAENNGSFFESW